MANPEHLQILEQGVEAWNAWREQNEGSRPDLSRVNFSLTDVGDIHGRANLREANLLRTDLTMADPSRANFRGAKLCRELETFCKRSNV